MGRMIKILALIAALYFAYDYFIVRGGGSAFRLPAPRAVPTGEPVHREPGRGLNPFVTDTDHAAPPQRPRVPDVPGSGR
ncbi:MAG: hypothetical protein ACREQY_23185 [Candidatus Binatia bacterium]